MSDALATALNKVTSDGVKVVPATANPGPLGLLGFAFTTFLLQGVFTTATGDNGTLSQKATANMTYAFGFFFGGLAQFTAGILEYPRKNTFATAAFCSYGAFWMSIALHGTLVADGVYQGNVPGDNTVAIKSEQLMLSLWGFITFIFWLCTFSMNAAISSLFLSLALLFWFLAGGQDPNSQAAVNLKKFAGGWGMFVAAIAFYCAAAQLMEDSYGRPILPTMPFKAINKRQLGSIGTKHFVTKEGQEPGAANLNEV